MQSTNHVAAVHRCRSRALVNVRIKHQHGENYDLSDFDLGMFVGAIWANSSVSETADLIAFPHTDVSKVYTKIHIKHKTLSPC